MNHEDTATETTSRVANLKDKVRNLPWKKIAIAAAVTTAAALVVKNLNENDGPMTFEATNIEILDDGSALVDMTPIDN